MTELNEKALEAARRAYTGHAHLSIPIHAYLDAADLVPRRRLAECQDMRDRLKAQANPVPRPDVERIAAEYDKLQFFNEQDKYSELVFLVTDIPALITYIKALEAVVKAAQSG